MSDVLIYWEVVEISLRLLAGQHVAHDIALWPVGSERMHLQLRVQHTFMLKGILLIIRHAYYEQYARAA